MENRYKITIDMKNRVISNTKFKQGDTDSSVLEINLVDNSLAVDITGQAIVFNFAKSDGTIVTQDITTGVSILNALNGNFQCILKNNTLAAPGLVNCEITFSDSGEILSTATFNFNVEKSIGNGPLSTSYISAVDNKLIEWQSEFDIAETARETEYNTIKNDYLEALELSAEAGSLEIVAARKGEVDLPTKIGKIDTQLADIAINVKSFGAIGDGINDDTIAIQNAFNTGKSIIFEKDKNYLVNGLHLTSINAVIYGNGATLKTDGIGNTCIFIDYPAKNIKIDNLKFLGFTDATSTTEATNDNSAGIDITSRSTSFLPYSEVVGVEISNCNFLGNFCFSIIATHTTNLKIHNCMLGGNEYVPSVSAGGYCILTQACFYIDIYNNKFVGQIHDRHAIYISSISANGSYGDNRCQNVNIHNNYVDWVITETLTELAEAFGIRNPLNCYIYANTIIGGYGAILINPSHGNAENIHIYDNNLINTKNRTSGEIPIIGSVAGDTGNDFITKNLFIHDNIIESPATIRCYAISPTNCQGFEIINNHINIGDTSRGIYLVDSSDGIVANNNLNGNNVARAWITYGTSVSDVDIMPNKIKNFANFPLAPEVLTGAILTNVKHKYKRQAEINGNGVTAYVTSDVHGLISSITSTWYGCDIVFNPVYNLSPIIFVRYTANPVFAMTRAIDPMTNTYSLNLYDITMINTPLASITTVIGLICDEY